MFLLLIFGALLRKPVNFGLVLFLFGILSFVITQLCFIYVRLLRNCISLANGRRKFIKSDTIRNITLSLFNDMVIKQIDLLLV